RDECFAATFTLVVEQYAVAGKQAITFAEIDRYPIGEGLGDRIGTARIKWRGFSLWYLLNFAEQFGRRSLIEARLAESGFANRFEQTKGSQCYDLGCIFGDVKAYTHVRLRAEVIYLIGLDIAQNLVERACIIQIA